MDVKTAKELLKYTERDGLIEIICKLSNVHSDADAWLRAYCDDHHEEEKNLAIQKNILEYWDIAEEIIADANEYGGTSYKKEDEASDALYMIDELVQKNAIPWTFRKTIVDDMLEQLYYGNSGFDDALYDSCSILCKTKEEKLYLADALNQYGSDYYRGVAADLYLRYGEEEAFVETQMQNLQYGSDYIKLADYYQEHGQNDKAVLLVEEALTKSEGRMDEVYKWLFQVYRKANQEEKIQKLYKAALKKGRDLDTIIGLMYEYYSGDYEKKKAYLLRMPEVCSTKEVRKWFDKCRDELKAEDFSDNAEHLYTTFRERNVSDYLQLRIDEGNVEEVRDYLKTHSLSGPVYGYRVDRDHKLSRQVAGFFPEEICNLYWEECENLCLQSNKKNYMAAVHVLVEIKDISEKHGLSEAWEKRYSAFLEKHKRKKLLMGYIREGSRKQGRWIVRQ